MPQGNEWCKIVKQNNDLLKRLKFNPQLDKVKLAELIEVSPPTLYKNLENLKKQSILNEDTTINSNFGTFMGVSVGTSFCKVVFLHFDFTEYTIEEFKPFIKELQSSASLQIKEGINFEQNYAYIYFKTPGSFSELKESLDGIFNVVKLFVENNQLVLLGIGISSTGSIDENVQMICQSHNLPYLDGRTIEDFYFSDKNEFFQKRNIPLFLLQNSIATAIAEKTKMHSDLGVIKCDNIAALYLDYGISTGFVLNGKLFTGTNGFAGEVGHLSISNAVVNQLDGLITKNSFDIRSKCTCGAEGCIDHVLRSLAFSDCVPAFSDMNSKEIAKYLEENQDAAKCVGIILGNITNTIASILNIDVVVLSGKLYKSISLLHKYIEQALDENSLKFNRRDCKIHVSKIGTMAPAIGAAIYSYYKSCNIPVEWV